MREGSLEAPIRHPVPWRDEAYYDSDKLDAELRRTFDICHGCRRCFNLCDSFPRLFDLVDSAPSGEVDTVSSTDFKSVVDACTLCDLCFMTKCPYVPPHEWDLDFPHLMLRYRAREFRNRQVAFTKRQLTETDRNGTLVVFVAPLANWGSRCGNSLTRPVLERIADVDRRAELPRYVSKTFARQARENPPPINRDAPGFGRKALLFATCFATYNNPEIAMAALRVLARNGVEVEVAYPRCCGMPQMEYGDLARVAANARQTSAELRPWIDKGYDVVVPIPSCALMMKFEWPLLEPDEKDVDVLSRATFDVSEYIISIARKEGLAPGLRPLPGDVTVHIACHARAQNIGQKAAELLRLLPNTKINVIERCSGHGGSWGVMKENFGVALKMGRPVAQQAQRNNDAFVVSECPLARDHIIQGMEILNKGQSPTVRPAHHPIELLAHSYGIDYR